MTNTDPSKRLIIKSDESDLEELASRKGGLACNPIVDWTESDVWDYIRDRRLPYNPFARGVTPCNTN